MIATVIATSALLLFQTGKGSIEGVVINNITNQPIAGAQVTATRIGTPRLLSQQGLKCQVASLVGLPGELSRQDE